MGNVQYDEEFILNSRGLKLFTCKWIPMNQEPKALIFMCHDYAMECSITMNSTAKRLAKEGFAVYGIDYQGHGKSAGLACYINSFNNLVDDCFSHFGSICERKENKGKMRYLLGNSMGGAVALLLHKKSPHYWDGAIFVAPMCNTAHEMRSNLLGIIILSKLCKIFPKWKLIPTKDTIEIAIKDPEIRQEIIANPYCYKGRAHVKTCYELLRISLDLDQRLQEVSLPFILLHGKEDKVINKAFGKQFYNVASSKDKTIKLYPGMWHGLLYGELPNNVDIVITDIIDWLEKRVSIGNSRLEKKQKYAKEVCPSLNKSVDTKLGGFKGMRKLLSLCNSSVEPKN